MPHPEPTDFDAWKLLALCRQHVFIARRDSSSTAAPADAYEPKLLAESNDLLAGTTLIATVCNDFVQNVPGAAAHALKCKESYSSASVGFKFFNRTRVREALLLA